MSVVLLIVTHNHVGAELLDTATAVLGGSPLPAAVLAVTTGCDRDELIRRGRAMLDSLDQGRGVLVLTDMFGSTPSNIATALVAGRDDAAVIAGINLPMLVRLLNYPNLDLSLLKEKALSGGREGIFVCSPELDF